MGGSQSDIANLNTEDIDWKQQTIGYARKKTGSLAIIHFGDEIAEILRRLPASGPLFPYMQKARAAIAPPSSNSVAMASGFAVSLCTRIVTHGRSARENVATPNGSPRKRSGTIARPSIVPTRSGRKFGCRLWNNMNAMRPARTSFRSTLTREPLPLVSLIRRKQAEVSIDNCQSIPRENSPRVLNWVVTPPHVLAYFGR